jgi:hypothetical protein
MCPQRHLNRQRRTFTSSTHQRHSATTHDAMSSTSYAPLDTTGTTGTRPFTRDDATATGHTHHEKRHRHNGASQPHSRLHTPVGLARCQPRIAPGSNSEVIDPKKQARLKHIALPTPARFNTGRAESLSLLVKIRLAPSAHLKAAIMRA